MARLFVAVDIAVDVVERLVILQRELARRIDADVRWVAAPDIHVTLKFLGETDDAMVPLIHDAMVSMARPLFPFEVKCCRVGAFPDAGDARIVWAGLDEGGAEVMGLLQQTLERDLGNLGIAAENREYRPHITLGRVKSRVPLNMASTLENFSNLDFGTSTIRDLVLFESDRSEDASARYTVRRRVPLGDV